MKLIKQLTPVNNDAQACVFPSLNCSQKIPIQKYFELIVHPQTNIIDIIQQITVDYAAKYLHALRCTFKEPVHLKLGQCLKKLMLECHYLILYYEIFNSFWHFEVGDLDIRHVRNPWKGQSVKVHVRLLRRGN